MSFPTYADNKETGDDWLDEVPAHWEFTPLRRLIVDGVSNGLFKKKDEFGQGTLLLNVFDVYQNDFKVKHDQLDRVTCTDEENASYEVLPNDLFFVRSSLKQEGVAVVCVAVECEEPVVYECHLIRARPDSTALCGRFGSYVLNSAIYRAKLIAKAKVTTMTTIDQESIVSTQIPVPPLDEQKAISSFLDVETSKIDGLVSEQRRLIQLLTEKRDSLARRATQLPETKHLRLGVVADQMERQIERIDDEEYTPIGMYNRGRGIFHKEPTLGADLGDSTFFRIAEDDFILSGQFAWEGAIALATEGENGCVASHRYPVFRGKPGVVDSAYLLAFFETPRGQLLLDLHSRGAAGRNRPLNARTLMKENIPVPSLDVQNQIAAIVRKETPFRQTADRAIELLQERRTALISAAVTGKIDVREFAYQETA